MKKPSIKNTVTDITQTRIYLRGTKKIGKTTLFRDIILEKYKSPEYGVLLGIGAELGYSMLDALNSLQIESWQDLIEFKKWLLSDDEDAKKIKMIAIDTIDELIPLAEKEICRQHEVKKKERCDSINKAFGGFGKGQDKTAELIKSYFYELHKAGYGIFAIAHTKLRNVVDKGSEGTDGYQVLTSNLTTKYEAVFGDIFDIVITGTIERDINDKILQGEKRVLYFRGNTRIDAGGRFSENAVPEYIVFEGEGRTKLFLDTVENGLKNSLKYKKSDKEYEEYKNKVDAEHNKKSDEIKNKLKETIIENPYLELAENEGLEIIRKFYGLKNQDFITYMKEYMSRVGIKSVSDLNTNQLSELIEYGVKNCSFTI